MTGRYEKAAIRRQAAIDYITAYPGALAPEIIAALGWKKCSGASRLADMTDRGELARTQTLYRANNANGKGSAVTTYAYTVCTGKTKSACEVMEVVAANLDSNKTKTRPEKNPTPWRTVNREGSNQAYKAQRGQGALRPSPRRGCSLS